MKVAVVGSGVSGLAATWLLNEHSDHEVHLYEADNRPGGHANTVRFVRNGISDAEGVDVDTGFIVLNPTTYPNFLRFLKLFPPTIQNEGNRDSGIPIVDTEMTFSVSRDGGVLEWAGKNLASVFCQRWRILDSDMWRMLYDIFRFNVCSRRVLQKPPNISGDMSIGEYLKQENYSSSFTNNYLVPMTAAIWSTPPGNCFLDFPSRTLIQFMYNHHLLQVVGKPSWLTILGGSHKYVKRILSKLPKEQLHMSVPVIAVRSQDTENMIKPKVVISTPDGDEISYDHVIMACHSDTSLKLLRAGGNVTEQEERILGQFKWNVNEAVLHWDKKLMPQNRAAWSCWNYLSFTAPGKGKGKDISIIDSGGQNATVEVNQVSLTYGMNDLQHIPESRYGPVLVSLNPPFEPDEDKIVGRWPYCHPVLDESAVRAQEEMHEIQNARSISYAGAWLKYGFHEDGFTSGLLAACSLDVDQEKICSAMSNTAFMKDMVIPTVNITVRPPFTIRHADHHIRLMKEWSIFYSFMAFVFDIFEGSRLRWLIGLIGSIVLGVLRRLFGL